jgi:hypothetical protein
VPRRSRGRGADEDERQLAAAAGFRRRGGGGLEPPEHVVAQVDPLGEILEVEPVLREPGGREHAQDGAERHDEPAVADRMDAVLGLYARDLVLEVDSCRSSDQEFGVGAHLPERDDGVPALEACRTRPRGGGP